MKDNEIVKAFDILDKFEFFGGQRAGRELWFNKPVEIQEKDIDNFLRDIGFLKQFINRQKAEIELLKEILCTSKVLTATCAGVRIKTAKEFAEKIKEKNGNDFLRSWYEGADECYEFNQEAFEEFIDNLLKEIED